MDEFIKVQEQYYILANTSMAEEQSRILKNGETFAIFDKHGDIRPFGFEEHGIFFEGTRFLSRMRLKINQKSPLLLSSFVKQDNDFLVVDMTNPDIHTPEGVFIPRGTIYIIRTLFLFENHCYQSMSVANYGLESVSLNLSLQFEADYVDIFEVRGIQRLQRGRFREPLLEENAVTLSYEGLDHVVRKTRISFGETPSRIAADAADFRLWLKPQEQKHISGSIACLLDDSPFSHLHFVEAYMANKRLYENYCKNISSITTSNEQFNNWLQQSRADLHMLTTETGLGPYPFAGIPWFSTVFGRDGLITALQTLWIYPQLAGGVLNYLAHHQAQTLAPEQDAEPGKILHEVRKGEMAALHEIPFGKYYGTIDATPLFVILAGYYLERTADLNFMEKIWPAIEKSLFWIDEYGDIDKDGFVEYARRSDKGLSNQGWKDSEDSIFYADGKLCEAPIALCEVQAYVYEAKIKASEIALCLGKKRQAVALKKQAAVLRAKFIETFWCEEIGMYVIALDGNKKPCKTKSSNAGHCLFSGIASEDHARKIVANLLGPTFFSGWGIRTIASSEARFNPMSYHNGSVWPHDNSLIAHGMARYGFKEAATEVMNGLFNASFFLDLHRMPELFCGFEKRHGEGPTLYPVACDPQAWAAGSIFLMLQSCLGLSIRAKENQIYFHQPVLPSFLNEVHIENLRVAESSLDISFLRTPEDVSIVVRKKTGNVGIVTVK